MNILFPEILLTTGGAGTSSAGASRSASNRNALKSSIPARKRSSDIGKSNKGELSFFQPTSEQLQDAKSQIKAAEKNSRKKELIILFAVIVVLSTLVYFFF